MDSLSSAIKIENVWKVFGNTSNTALNEIQNNRISKTEALEKYNSVIGVSDVSFDVCLLYTSPSPRDQRGSRMPSSA